jgi:hypothetical protein
MLRAAAVGGGAYYMGKRRAQGQEQALAPSDQAATPPASPTAGDMSGEAIQRLQELAELHKQGVLTDEEFAAQKARILG